MRPEHSEAGLDVTERLDVLREAVRRRRRLIVAFSGGADSGLLAAVAANTLHGDALAVTAVSPSLPHTERVAARDFAKRNGIRHLEICTDEQDRPEYRANGGDRCYHCKSALFDALQPLSELLGASVALGTNLDDLGDHRPGHRAAADQGILAPLVEAGFTKQAVREASRELGLSTADKPAAACLASRVAYGDPVTPELLRRIDAMESAVHQAGFLICRVRAHGGGTVARVEVPQPDIERAAAQHRELEAAARTAGFKFCSLDLGGFRSGGMNVLLPFPAGRKERPARST